MILVVDASVAAKWYFQEEDSAAAEALEFSARLIAPEVILAEVGNVLWKRYRRGDLDYQQLSRAITHLPEALSKLLPIRPLFERAMHIAARLDHPVYDCIYLALAELGEGPLVTADIRLLGRVRATPWERMVLPLGSSSYIA